MKPLQPFGNRFLQNQLYENNWVKHITHATWNSLKNRNFIIDCMAQRFFFKQPQLTCMFSTHQSIHALSHWDHAIKSDRVLLTTNGAEDIMEVEEKFTLYSILERWCFMWNYVRQIDEKSQNVGQQSIVIVSITEEFKRSRWFRKPLPIIAMLFVSYRLLIFQGKDLYTVWSILLDWSTVHSATLQSVGLSLWKRHFTF